jgi:hypothetical protein
VSYPCIQVCSYYWAYLVWWFLVPRHEPALHSCLLPEEQVFLSIYLTTSFFPVHHSEWGFLCRTFCNFIHMRTTEEIVLVQPFRWPGTSGWAQRRGTKYQSFCSSENLFSILTHLPAHVPKLLKTVRSDSHFVGHFLQHPSSHLHKLNFCRLYMDVAYEVCDFPFYGVTFYTNSWNFSTPRLRHHTDIDLGFSSKGWRPSLTLYSYLKNCSAHHAHLADSNCVCVLFDLEWLLLQTLHSKDKVIHVNRFEWQLCQCKRFVVQKSA